MVTFHLTIPKPINLQLILARLWFQDQALSHQLWKIKEAYSKVNSKVEVEIQQSDSSTGITNAIEGTADIGMASRDLKDEETSKGVSSTVIAIDGIAVIVNKDNKVDGLTSEQVKTIFTGKTTSWDGLSD